MIAEDKTGKAAEKIDGYTPEQRFFLGFGAGMVREAATGVSRACRSIPIRTRRADIA